MADLRYVKIFWDTPKLKGEKVMDFIRKNWSRLSLALLFLLGGILGIVAFVNTEFLTGDNNVQKFFSIALLVSTMLYFFGMACVTVLKCLAGKKTVSITYMVIGGIISVLEIVVLCVCMRYPYYTSLVGPNASSVFFEFVVPTLIFGFYPLIKGITRFIEAEQTPAPAKMTTVQPTAAAKPAEQPAAPAKKPAAKTTASTKAK